MGNGIDLDGKVVLVTGGSRGIGRGIATRFLESGCEVVICGRNPPESLPAVGDRLASFVAGDVRDVEQIDKIVAAVVERHGRLDVLVNNAGGSPPADAATVSPRFSASIIQLNLIAPLWLAQRANAVMQRQDAGGTIINIASVSGVRPSPGTAAYGAAKAGLINLTQSLAVEWAPKVRVVAVTPGPVRTEQAALHYGDADSVARVESTIPLGRMADPREVGHVVAFLASDLASYVSGAVVACHGGGEPPVFLHAVKG